MRIDTVRDGETVASAYTPIITFARNYDTNLAKEAPVDFLDPEPGETRE